MFALQIAQLAEQRFTVSNKAVVQKEANNLLKSFKKHQWEKSYINTIFQLFLFKQDGKNYHQSEQMREQRRAGYNSQPETCVSSGIWRTDFPAWWNRGHVSSSFVPVTRFTQRQRVHEFHSNTWELVSVSQRKWRTCTKLQKLSECPSSVTHPHTHTYKWLRNQAYVTLLSFTYGMFRM